MNIDEQLELPGFKKLLFQSYITHELQAVSSFYISLLNKGLPAIGKDEFIMQYVDSGLAKQFYENYGWYYGQTKSATPVSEKYQV